jgi:hypothetical protein
MRALVLMMLAACAHPAPANSPAKSPAAKPPIAAPSTPRPTGFEAARSRHAADSAKDESADERRARERALAALSDAQLSHLTVAERAVRAADSERPNLWELAVNNLSATLLVDLDDGRVSMRDLQQEWTLERWPEIRARAEALAEWVSTLGFVKRFCKQQSSCMYWIEEAPAPDCSKSCQWSAYLGISNGTMTLRHFTLRIDEQKRTAVVVDLEGRERPAQ